jgi:hypothetical protein
MAIAYMVVSNISRGTGKSAVAAAAYRSGETLHNEREGNTYSYARKSDRVYNEILAPREAPEWARIREALWNEVEHIEKQSNARLAREIMVALPKELTQEQNIALVRAYAQTFANEGMVADLSIHDKGDGNPHAHIMLTTRPFQEDGTWGAKSKKAYILNTQGEKIKLKSGEYKSRKVDTVDWNKSEKIEAWRERYEHITNDHLEKAGFETRIDARSYERQGKEQIPTVHMGHFAHSLEQQGIETKVGNINRQIQAENQEREALKKQLDATLSALEDERKRHEKEEARREAINRKHTITEEAMQQKVAEWERQASFALQQPTPESTGWEALRREAAEREEVWKREEQERREAEARRAFEQHQKRKFVKPSPFERPFRLARPKRRRGVDWNTLAEALRSRKAGHLDWQQLAKRAEKGRVDWSKLAEQQAGRIDWKQLAETAGAEKVDWKQEASRAETGRADWQQLVEEGRRHREDETRRGEKKKPLRDLYTTEQETYTSEQQEHDDQDKRE